MRLAPIWLTTCRRPSGPHPSDSQGNRLRDIELLAHHMGWRVNRQDILVSLTPGPAVFSYPSTPGWRGVRRWRKSLPKSLQGMHCALTLTSTQTQNLSPSILHTGASPWHPAHCQVLWSREEHVSEWKQGLGQLNADRKWSELTYQRLTIKGEWEQTYKGRKCSKDGQGPDRGGGGRGHSESLGGQDAGWL